MRIKPYKILLFFTYGIILLSFATSCAPTAKGPATTATDGGEGGGGSDDPPPVLVELFVRATPNPGLYSQSINVFLLASDSDAKIYFSADKNILPQKTDDFLYEKASAITITQDTLLRYFASRGAEITEIKSASYVIDFEAPSISFVQNTQLLSKEDMVIKVQASDPSDVNETRYTINDATKSLKEGEIYNSTSGIVLTAKAEHEETYEVRVQAFDRVDKASNLLVQNFVIDKKAPSISFSPDAGTFRAGPKVKVTSTDAAQLFYTTGTGTADDPTENSTSISSGDEIQIDSDNTLLKVLAMDEAGNKTITSKLYNIDATAPLNLRATTNISEIQSLSDGTHILGDNFKVILSTEDPTDLIYYTLNNVDANNSVGTLYTAPIDFAIAKDTEKNFVLKFIAYDRAGNFTVVHTEKYFLDRKAPALTLNPPSGIFSTDVTVDIFSSEKGYALVTTNGSEPLEGATHTEKMQLSQSAPFKVSFKRITPGLNTIKAKVVDLARHASDIETRSYTIDNDAPDLVISPTAKKLFNAAFPVTISSKADDLKDIMYCTVQGGGSCTPSQTISNSAGFQITFEGKTTVFAKATDQLGNAFETSTTYEMDKTKPTLSFSPAKEVYGDIASQNITITASEESIIYYTTAPYNEDGRDPSHLGNVTGQKSGSSPLSFDLFDSTTMKAIALDNAGNVTEPVQLKRIRFDRGVRSAALFPASYGPHKDSTSFKLECKNNGAINTAAKAHYAINRDATDSDDSFNGAGNLSANHFASQFNRDFTLNVLCKDQFSETKLSRKYHIDTIAPQISLSKLPTTSGDSTITAGGDDFIGDTLLSITIKNKKDGDKLFIKINNFGESAYVDQIRLTQDTTLFIRTQDAAQNEATYGPLVYKVFADKDGDRIADYLDSCPNVANTGIDSDGDKVDNACDLCDYTPDASAHPLYGQHGTMQAGLDSDGDGVGDACDTCRLQKNAQQIALRDYTNQNGRKVISKYNDGSCDSTDIIPFGFCGGACQTGFCKDVASAPAAYASDQDSDGILDICDAKFIPELGRWIKTDKDDDNDGVKDMFCTPGSQGCDNCQGKYNPLQIDSDNDDEKGHGGDACDQFPLDHDNDGFDDHIKLSTPSQTHQRCEFARAYTRAEQKVVASSKGYAQANVDAGLLDFLVKPAALQGNGKICDACYTQADTQDADGDHIHNACDTLTDRDQDGISDAADYCDSCGAGNVKGCAIHAKTNLKAMRDNLDTDGEGIGDVCDNCPNHSNFSQTDEDKDGIGDECDAFEIVSPKEDEHVTTAINLPQIRYRFFTNFTRIQHKDRSAKLKHTMSYQADFSNPISTGTQTIFNEGFDDDELRPLTEVRAAWINRYDWTQHAGQKKTLYIKFEVSNSTGHIATQTRKFYFTPPHLLWSYKHDLDSSSPHVSQYNITGQMTNQVGKTFQKTDVKNRNINLGKYTAFDRNAGEAKFDVSFKTPVTLAYIHLSTQYDKDYSFNYISGAFKGCLVTNRSWGFSTVNLELQNASGSKETRVFPLTQGRYPGGIDKPLIWSGESGSWGSLAWNRYNMSHKLHAFSYIQTSSKTSRVTLSGPTNIDKATEYNQSTTCPNLSLDINKCPYLGTSFSREDASCKGKYLSPGTLQFGLRGNLCRYISSKGAVWSCPYSDYTHQVPIVYDLKIYGFPQ